MTNNLKVLEDVLQHKYVNRQYLIEALTHSSYANEVKTVKMHSNERLEFLGDSVLGIIISDYLFNRFPNLPEGELTKLRSKVVCEGTLADISRELNIGKFMFFGKGEIRTGGRNRPSILADAFEAVIASIYKDGGMPVAKTFVLRHLISKIDAAEKGEIFVDYKTRLQEIVQAHKQNRIKYELLDATGPDHNKTFRSAVKLNNEIIGVGEGHSKKEAEQKAASAALKEANKIEKETL